MLLLVSLQNMSAWLPPELVEAFVAHSSSGCFFWMSGKEKAKGLSYDVVVNKTVAELFRWWFNLEMKHHHRQITYCWENGQMQCETSFPINNHKAWNKVWGWDSPEFCLQLVSPIFITSRLFPSNHYRKEKVSDPPLPCFTVVCYSDRQKISQVNKHRQK